MSKHNGSNGKHLPTKQFMRQIEQHAIKIRQKAGLGPSEKLDPIAKANQLQIQVQFADELEGLSTEVINFLRNSNAKDWSGGADGRKLQNGKLLITLHPNQTPERINVTILEEVAHDYYGHQPALLDGSRTGKYVEADEQEAYWTAAAALLPMKDIAQAVWLGKSIEDLAKDFGASLELVDMRLKTLGLWQLYKNRTSQS